MDAEKLTPRQAETVAALLDPEPVEWPADIAARLMDDAIDALAGQGLYNESVAEPIYVTVSKLKAANGCLRKLAYQDESPFEWSEPTAKGTIVHAALATWVLQPHLPAVSAARIGLARAKSDGGLGRWLRGLDDPEVFLEPCVEAVTTVQDMLPPIPESWRPATEVRYRAEFGQVAVLACRADLVFGRAQGTTARRVILDPKTGQARPEHRTDLAVYALAETLRSGVPPKLVGNLYTDAGTLITHDVDRDLLDVALRHLASGAARLDLLSKPLDTDELPATPSGLCRFCPGSDLDDDGAMRCADSRERT